MRVVHVDSAHEWRRWGRFAPVAVSGSLLWLAMPEAHGQSRAREREARVQKAPAASAASPLRQLDAELREITARVSPAVVQVLVSGYGAVDAGSPGQAALVSPQQRLGSGVILDPAGYIVTNAHVVKGARRVQVVLTKPDRVVDGSAPPGVEQSVLQATVVGFTSYFDLALLKVEATGLPTLPFADFWKVSQGQVVIAIGSPLGLDNSVTMGIISSPARQAKPESPVVFVQTDAPINPGNSGGALVDLDGKLVGINTFILSQAGGSEGLGFALPAPLVGLVYESLREKGYVDRRVIGVAVQTISPVLARGLGLPRAFGLVICDLEARGPGETAGLKVGDVIVEADGRSIPTSAELEGSIYLHDITQPLKLGVLRDGERLTFDVSVLERTDHADSVVSPLDPEANLVRRLGVMATTVTPELQSSLGRRLRIPWGVAVMARTADVAGLDLSPGDVIHAVNSSTVTDVDALRSALEILKPGDAVVLQLERADGLRFVGLELPE
jgi:serine protease Do